MVLIRKPNKKKTKEPTYMKYLVRALLTLGVGRGFWTVNNSSILT